MSFYDTISEAYVASDPYCKTDCSKLPHGIPFLDQFILPGPPDSYEDCTLKKFTLGCGGGQGLASLRPAVQGKVTKSGMGGETVNPASGCISGDILCEAGHQVQAGAQQLGGNALNISGQLAGKCIPGLPVPCWILLAAGATVVVAILILRR